MSIRQAIDRHLSRVGSFIYLRLPFKPEHVGLTEEQLGRLASPDAADAFQVPALPVDPSLAFDIGAYSGNSIERLESLGYSKIICLEANPLVFRTLRRKLRHSRTHAAIRRAASDIDGEDISFVVDVNHPWLSTADPTWMTNPRHAPLFTQTLSVRANTITLDSLISVIGSMPSYIKIDVEGYEPAVLRGLSRRPKILSFEWVSESPARNCDNVLGAERLGFTQFTPMVEEEAPSANTPRMTSTDCCTYFHQVSLRGSRKGGWGNVWCW